MYSQQERQEDEKISGWNRFHQTKKKNKGTIIPVNLIFFPLKSYDQTIINNI